MQLVPLFDFQLRYTSLIAFDYGTGGQYYGTMEGRAHGERLSGSMRLTNFAPRRADDVNMPTLRGVLETDDGVQVYVEMNGIATLREADAARVFVTSVTFRTGDERYRWLNTTFAVLEGVLKIVAEDASAEGRAFVCEPAAG